jgi:DNA-binding NtrC family response regulator
VLCPGAGDLRAAPGAVVRPAAEWRASGTALVADDDEGAREILSETLSRAGFDVLCAVDGREAMEIFRTHADAIRVVLLDCTMPGASGEETLDGIRRIRPEVPVLLVSGYSRESAAPELELAAGCAFLQKPFLPEDLIEAVRQLLPG